MPKKPNENGRTSHIVLNVLGYDPGGGGSHGAAVTSVGKNGSVVIKVMTLDNVSDAISWFSSECIVPPNAAGIDTLLSWPFKNNAGWRAVDRYLRKSYPDVARSVISANGLYGSMCLNGMSMAFKLREKWSHIVLNETHPKMLYRALTGKRYAFKASMTDWLQCKSKASNQLEIKNEHEWDAAISAWFTFQSFIGETNRDLAEEHQDEELIYPVGSVHYYWPNEDDV
jgi:hypothetical protein